MSIGVTVFLVLLCTASHVLLNLWTLNMLDAVAYDTAVELAVASPDLADPEASHRLAAESVSASLGTYGERASVDVHFVDGGDAVTVVVAGPSLSLLPRPIAQAVGLDRLERRATVRTERMQ